MADQFTFTPVNTAPGQPAPGPRQITPIDDTPVQYATGRAPMFTGEPTQAMQFGQPTLKTPLTFTPTITAEQAAAAPELRPTQMAEVLPERGMPTRAGVGALQAMTFDPDEFKQILQALDPSIEVNIGPEGGIYVTNPKVGKMYALNKPGASLNDAINVGTAIVSGLATGLAGSAARRVAAEAIIQTLIETGQYAAGGEFDPEEVAFGVVGSAASEVPGMMARSRAGQQVYTSAVDLGAAPEQAADIVRVAEAQGRPVAAQQEVLRDIIRPEPSKVRAATELGLEEVTPARVVSGNPQYVEIEQALVNIPGTQLAAAEKEFISGINEKVTGFIEEYGGPGARDVAGMSDAVRTEVQQTISDSVAKSNDLYDEISRAVPGRTRIEDTAPLDEIRKNIRSRAIDMGGINRLPKIERDLYRELQGKAPELFAVRTRTEPRPMTYARLDELRKIVGEKLGNASRGALPGDETSFQLSRIYGDLTRAQDSVIGSVAGNQVADIWSVAKGLVAERKAYEDVVRDVMGRDLERSVVPKLASSITQLGQGKVEAFRKTIQAIPENMRQQAVSSAMNNVFLSGARTAEAINPAGFAALWRNITRNATARKELMQYLPNNAERFLDNLSVVLQGYADASRIPRTGAINALERYNSDGGLVQKILPTLIGGRATNALGSVLSKTDTEIPKSAADMLGNPNLKRMIARQAEGKPVDRLEDAMMSSPAFQAWIETIPANLKTRILTVGLADYLFEDGINIPGFGDEN